MGRNKGLYFVAGVLGKSQRRNGVEGTNRAINGTSPKSTSISHEKPTTHMTLLAILAAVLNLNRGSLPRGGAKSILDGP